jgi:hypothetical protein
MLFNNSVRPLTRRQNDNLAPKQGKVAQACLTVYSSIAIQGQIVRTEACGEIIQTKAVYCYLFFVTMMYQPTLFDLHKNKVQLIRNDTV